MADSVFPAITAPTVVGVRNLTYTLFDPDPDYDEGWVGGARSQSMTYQADIVWSDGKVKQMKGDVVPHLTAAEISGLQTLMARLRAKAETAWGDAP